MSGVSQRIIQHYYIFGKRAIYSNGWKAEAAHHPDFIDFENVGNGVPLPVSNYDDDVWELYNINEDFNERFNLAKKYPEKLKELQALLDVKA